MVRISELSPAVGRSSARHAECSCSTRMSHRRWYAFLAAVVPSRSRGPIWRRNANALFGRLLKFSRQRARGDGGSPVPFIRRSSDGRLRCLRYSRSTPMPDRIPIFQQPNPVQRLFAQLERLIEESGLQRRSRRRRRYASCPSRPRPSGCCWMRGQPHSVSLPTSRPRLRRPPGGRPVDSGVEWTGIATQSLSRSADHAHIPDQL
jgi:hypothetical protein